MTERIARLTNAATVGSYRAGQLIARALPAPAAGALSSSIGWAAGFGNAERRAMFARHLRRVEPTWTSQQVSAATQQAFASYARYWVESLRLPSLSADTVERGFALDGFEAIAAAIDRGEGAILALPHLGGWEWAGRWLTLQGYRVSVVVERLDPPELFRWFADLRARLGMTVVPLGPEAGRAVLRALKDNEVVCLLCDRDLGRSGVEVEFFGERTTLPAGPATLALRTGAPLFPVGVYFTDRTDGHHAIVRPPVALDRHGSLREDVARVTQTLAHELEWLIRRAPDQWHLFQPNWPSDPGY